MKIQLKNTLTKLFAFAILATALSTAITAQIGETRSNELRARHAASRNVSTRSLASTVASTNRLNYQIGKDFALAILDAKGIDESSDLLNYTIVDLVYLIDGTEGQPEAAQLQKILKAVIRGTMDGAEVSAQIDAISKSYVARQSVEQKWYFNVGYTQVNLLLAGYANDDVGIKSQLRELKALAKTAPKTTPQAVVAAINGLTKYGSKPSFTEGDYTALINDIKIITNSVYA